MSPSKCPSLHLREENKQKPAPFPASGPLCDLPLALCLPSSVHGALRLPLPSACGSVPGPCPQSHSQLVSLPPSSPVFIQQLAETNVPCPHPCRPALGRSPCHHANLFTEFLLACHLVPSALLLCPATCDSPPPRGLCTNWHPQPTGGGSPCCHQSSSGKSKQPALTPSVLAQHVLVGDRTAGRLVEQMCTEALEQPLNTGHGALAGCPSHTPACVGARPSLRAATAFSRHSSVQCHPAARPPSSLPPNPLTDLSRM